jgi:hypothetical protein
MSLYKESDMSLAGKAIARQAPAGPLDEAPTATFPRGRRLLIVDRENEAAR